jgi:hypothetical protein
MTVAVAPEEHSSLVGGSTAARRIACPASYQMEAKVPAVIKETSSAYADEGSGLHLAMAHILTRNMVAAEVEQHVLGQSFGGLRITEELLDEAVLPALAYFDSVVAEIDPLEKGVDVLVENRVEVPGVPGAFGTADVIIRGPTRSAILDWKFGVGVPVFASHQADHTMASGEVVPVIEANAQLAFYARGAIHTYPQMFGEGVTWPVDLHIVQPRSRGGTPFSKHTTNVAELEQFRMKLVRAVAEAKGPNPTMTRGDHCRFAACKTICPRWTLPTLDLTKMHGALTAKKGGLATIRIDWPLMYAELLTLADMAEMVAREVRAQAHAFLTDGHSIPGYKLVNKRAQRKWIDEEEAQIELTAMVGGEDLCEPPTLRSPAQIEKVLKKAKLELPEHLVEAVSSGTTIAPTDDRREAVIPIAGQIAQLSQKLLALKVE